MFHQINHVLLRTANKTPTILSCGLVTKNQSSQVIVLGSFCSALSHVAYRNIPPIEANANSTTCGKEQVIYIYDARVTKQITFPSSALYFWGVFFRILGPTSQIKISASHRNYPATTLLRIRDIIGHHTLYKMRGCT